MRIPFILMLFVLSLSGSAEVMDIGIYRHKKIERVVLTPSKGAFEVFGDNKLLMSLDPNQGVRINVQNGKVSVKTIAKDFGTFNKVEVIRKSWGNEFRLQPMQPKDIERKYNDNLLVTEDKGHLKLINRVSLEYYVAGVVEAESGSKQNSEYYKLQAIVCRTYALNNLRRHQGEGFNLCDQVHCQVYHGVSRFSELIPKAVSATQGLVVVDSDINLITASFHSNCGGQTINAEDVWSMPLPYLQSVRDTFCLNGKHAEWETRIPRADWLNYLKRTHNYPVNNAAFADSATEFNSEHLREIFYASGDSGIQLKQIRSDWNLKSTYFRVQPIDGDIVITGKGFGHGVGMCQEGAMRMSELGFTYTEIIHYYYQGVHLIDLSVLDFFKEY